MSTSAKKKREFMRASVAATNTTDPRWISRVNRVGAQCATESADGRGYDETDVSHDRNWSENLSPSQPTVLHPYPFPVAWLNHLPYSPFHEGNAILKSWQSPSPIFLLPATRDLHHFSSWREYFFSYFFCWAVRFSPFTKARQSFRCSGSLLGIIAGSVFINLVDSFDFSLASRAFYQ